MNATTNLIDTIEAARSSAVKLTVFHLPPGLRTLVAVTPGAIETFPDVAIDEIADAAVIAGALDALAASKPARGDRPIDVRYGLIFEDAGGERVMRAYKGAFASAGQIDDVLCDYEEANLHEWLVARYPLPKNPYAEEDEE